MSRDEHQQIQDLLPRYATLQSEGKNAVAMYPSVAHHLERCYECRELLESLRVSSWPTETLKLNPTDLPFFRQPSASPTPVKPPPVTDASSPEIMRGFNAIQSGGRLLMHEKIVIGEQAVSVVLTLQPGPNAGTVTITGEIYAEAGSLDLQAHLDINGEHHVANASDGELVFENVKLDQTNPHFDLSLELLN